MTSELTPVEIKAKDNYKYGLSARVLDNPKILRRIFKFRRAWGIKRPHSQYLDWVNDPNSRVSDSTTGRTPLGFSKEVSAFREKCNLDPAYDKLIKMAVVCNRVRDEDLKLAYWVPIIERRVPWDAKYAIIVSPDARRTEDVERAWLSFQSDVKHSRQPGRKLKHRYIPNLPRKILNDTKGEIKKHRQWYWENQRGKGPLQIAREDVDRERGISISKYRDTIKWAIKSYKNSLTGCFS